MSAEPPVIIFGTGRCGSSLLHEVLSGHPRLAWLSQVAERRPARPGWNALALRSLELPLVGRLMEEVLDPSEAYPFWERVAPGFSEPCRDLRGDDVTGPVKERVRRELARMLGGRRNRLLLKVTGWPRVGWFHEVFPDARCLFVYRDGRAVASSLLRQSWWEGWSGPSAWRWGPLSPERRARWERHDRSFAVLAGLEWEILMEAAEEARRGLPEGAVLDVRYEELCRRPREVVASCLEHAGLGWEPRFERAFAGFTFRSANDRWREQLTAPQRREMEEALGPALERYGYGSADAGGSRWADLAGRRAGAG